MSELLLPQAGGGASASTYQPVDLSLKEAKQQAGEQVEAQILKEALTRFCGNISEVAKSLELTPRAIHQKINLHSIDPNDYRSRGRSKV